MPKDHQSSSSQIKNFLSVIIGGSLCGLLVVLGLLYTYGPTSTYLAKNVILSPEVLEKMWYNTSSASTQGQMARFSFKEIEFLHFDQDTSAWNSQELSIKTYGEFYQLVKGDKGSSENEELKTLFDQTPVATILIKASTNGGAAFRSIDENFQQIEFSSDGQAYRVELKENDKAESWAYFPHDNIYNKIMKIFKR